MSTFQKYILTKYIGWLRGKKILKNQFFCGKKTKFGIFGHFWSFLEPLTPLKFF